MRLCQSQASMLYFEHYFKPNIMSTSILTLKERYEQIKIAEPKLRIRDHAKLLQVSEAELLNLKTGETVTRLEGDFKEFLKEVYTLGRVMALTRNDHCVLERKGVYKNVSFDNHVGLVLDAEIDLRLFMQHWRFGFAVDESERLSFQFFDKAGHAVHKIYLTEKSDRSSYFRLKAIYKARDQFQDLITEVYRPADAEKPDNEIDIASFRQHWQNMRDTHQFFGIMRNYGVTRTQALRLAPEGFVQQVPNDAVNRILSACASLKVPIMIFTGSRGCIQIHSGEIHKLVQTGPWYNILDPELNMHLRTEAISQSYIVRKPTDDGTVTSLEIFDLAGNMIGQFFGKRKPGLPELTDWANIVKKEADFNLLK